MNWALLRLGTFEAALGVDEDDIGEAEAFYFPWLLNGDFPESHKFWDFGAVQSD